MSQPAKPSPLGRGLSALFGDADASYAPKASAPAPQAAAAAPGGRVLQAPFGVPEAPRPPVYPSRVAVTWLQPGAFQPRRNFDDEALKELAESIKACGVLEPLVVRPVLGLKDAYEIIAGERRWRAAQLAGLHDVPVVVRDLTDREALEFGLIENIQRQDLTPLEEAEGYKRLIDEFEHTHDRLSQIIGKSRAHIGNMLRVLTLPPAVRQMLETGRLTPGHARAIITARDPLELAEIVVRKGMSVRQTEALARREQADAKQVEADTKKARRKAEMEAAAHSLQKDMERVTGLKIKITPKTPGEGSFTLFYTNLDQLEMVIKRLKG